MKLLSATIASVVGAAVADPAVIVVPAAQAVHHPVAATQFVQQPVYVAAHPVQTGHQVVQLEQQLMRNPQMATMTHLYNIPQTVATVPVTVYQREPQPQQGGPGVVGGKVEIHPKVQKQPAAKPAFIEGREGEVSQQYHKQDDFGNYAYGYANDNSEKQEVGNTRSGEVKGHYTYVDGNGQNRRVDYFADNNGFRAKGDGIKIKREAEAEPEAEAAGPNRVSGPQVEMTSYMKSGADQPEGMRMTSYMSNGVPIQDMQQQVYVMPSMRMQSTLQQPAQSDSLMTYYNRPMVYMTMNGPSRGTFTATRTVDGVDSYNMGDRLVGNRQMGNELVGDVEAMRYEGSRDGDFDMMNMGRNANNGRQMDMSMRMEDNDMFYRGQYLNNNMYRNRLMRNNVFKTNPNNFMEIQQFEMKPNHNYRFDF